MLYQPPTGLHPSLLQAGQRPGLDSLGQRQPPPQMSMLPLTTLNRVRRWLQEKQWSGFRTIQQTDFRRWSHHNMSTYS
jgi:hypothetical protein